MSTPSAVIDDNGWTMSLVEAWPPEGAFSLLSRTAGARMDSAPWSHAARQFLGAALELAPPKRYPSGTVPLADSASLVVQRAAGGPLSHLVVQSLPLCRAPACLTAARAAAQHMGGAGFDRLVELGVQLWQVRLATPETGESCAALVAATALAHLLGAPILPPEGDELFGIKGGRLRLEAQGWTC